MDVVQQPLIDKQDYVPFGMDQLEKSFLNQQFIPKDLKEQFSDRFKRQLNSQKRISKNIQKQVDEIIASENIL